jgi:hypothetical protein
MATSGPPTLQTHGGLTPKIAIVNADGTPTMFFFRYLLTLAGSLINDFDMQVLEALQPGADAAIAGAQFDELRAEQRALELLAAAPPPAFELSQDQRALEALLFAPAPAAAAPATIRDVIANIPAGLNAGDAGRTFYSTDYQHGYRWTGSVWTFADGEQGSGFIRWFLVPPRIGRWQLCDGSTGIREALANGTTALVQFNLLAAGTVPNLTGFSAYLRAAAAASGAIGGAVFPVIDAANLHPVPAAAGSGGSNFVQSFDNPHTHTASSAGEPAHLDAMPYYRL